MLIRDAEINISGTDLDALSLKLIDKSLPVVDVPDMEAVIYAGGGRESTSNHV
jgi:hypothetical protein